MNSSTNLHFQETFDRKRLNLLPSLASLRDMGFYLAGGTGLALQIGHRKSIDFDFFVNQNFDPGNLYEKLLNKFRGEKIIKNFQAENTLYIEIKDIKISFFTYEHKLLKPLIKTENLHIADIIDIACMKLWAIQNRATNKDYIDIYYILKEFPLSEIINYFFKKYGKVINENHLLKSLVYFEDITHEKLRLNTDINFEDIKKFLKKQIKEYQNQAL